MVNQFVPVVAFREMTTPQVDGKEPRGYQTQYQPLRTLMQSPWWLTNSPLGAVLCVLALRGILVEPSLGLGDKIAEMFTERFGIRGPK